MGLSDTHKEGAGDSLWELIDTEGRRMVVGAVAHDAAAAGSPVRVGGVYRSSLPAVSAGDIVDFLMDAAGRLKVLNDVNQEVTALASTARTTTTNSSDLTNPGARGVIMCLDVTSVTDTPSIELSVEWKCPVSGQYEIIFTAAAAVTATGTHTYVIYPGDIVASDDVVEVAKLPLGRTWRVTLTHADADSITYSVGVSYVN